MKKWIATFTIAGTALYILYINTIKRRFPGPLQLPLLGTLLSAIPYISNKTSHDMLLDYYYKYGDVFELVLKGRKVFFVADAEVAKRILKDGDVFRRNKRLGEVTRGMLDGALFVIPTGPTWYRHRKLLQPAFGPSHLHDVARVTNERMDLVVDHWTRLIQEDSIVVDLYKNISSFGHEYKATESNIVEGKELELAKDIDEMTKIISRRLYLPDFMWNCFGLGVDDVKNVGMRERFESFVKPLIAERKAYWESQKGRLESSESSNGWNILDRLLYSKSTNAKGEAEGFTESEILEELLGFFGAGYETTSNSVVWAFSELSQRPDIVEKIRKEIKSVCEMKDGKWDIVDHLNDLKYLSNVIKETQRLHPVVITLRKECSEPVMLFDQHFDTDTAFQVNFIALFRNLKYWKDPKVFNPDRFDDLQEDCYFVPFGDGPMKCIGFRMAMIEMKLLVAKICIAFNMTLEPQKLVAVTSITHGLKNGLKVRLHKIE